MGFPVSPQPSPGDTYSADGRLWTYDGFGWRFLGASGSVNVSLSGLINYTIGTTSPAGPHHGDKWYHLNDAVEYTYILDSDNTSHWIEIGYGCPTIGGETGINFPTTECVGDLYEYDSRIWVYKGYAWKMVCQNIGDAEFTFGLTAPTGIRAGHRWVDSSSGILFTFVDDFDPSGQTGQWVAFDNSPVMIGPTGPQGIQGPTGATGNTGGAEYLYQLLDVNIDSETDYVSANDGKFLKYDNSITKWVMASIPLNLLSGICGGIVGSINGCTGDISIIGTTNEIEILNEACPQFQIGLPDNVTITGNLTVLGNYNGYVDGGVF